VELLPVSRGWAWLSRAPAGRLLPVSLAGVAGDTAGAHRGRHRSAQGRVHHGLNVGADSLLQEALTIQREWYGEEHPDVAVTFEELSRLAQGFGDWHAVEAPHQRALEIWQATLGPEADEMVAALLRMRQIKALRGDYPAADSLTRAAIAIRERRLGPDHPATIYATLFLGDQLLAYMGEYEEAAAIHSHAVTALGAVWGDEHPRLTHARNSLAAALIGLGRFDEAVALHRKQLALAERLQGPTHPAAVNAMYRLGENLILAGEFEEGATFFRRGLAIDLDLNGPHGGSVIAASRVLGRMLIEAEKFAAAESVLVPVLEFDIANGPLTTMAALTQQTMGRLYFRQGDHERAEPYYRSASDIMDYRMREGSLLAAHRRVQALYLEMAQFYSDWGREETANRYRELLGE
jgi:tetratricopeptide (TPR) repeat protein